MLYLAIFLVLSIIIIITLLIVILIYKHNIKIIAKQYKEIINSDTNAEILISSRQKEIKYFVKDINKTIKEYKKLRNNYYHNSLKLKQQIINLSHDLRTPITVIIGYLDLLEERGINNKELEVIKRRINELKDLTEDLFRFVIIEETNLVKEKLDVVNLLKESVLSFYNNFVKKNLKVSIDIKVDSLYIMANKEALNRVFNNIFSNIIKYADTDLVIMVENRQVIFRNHTKLIDKVKIGKIFDRFFTVNYQENSTGLGLDIARDIIEKLGYNISADLDNDIFSLIINFKGKDRIWNCFYSAVI